MNPQLIPGNEQVTPAFVEFRQASQVSGLHWTPEETLAAWKLFQDEGAAEDEPVKGKGKK